MTWYILALIAAVLVSVSTIIEKKTLQGEHAMEFSTLFALVNFCLALPFFLMIDYSRLAVVPLAILLLNSVIAATALLYTAKGLRHMDISASSPLYVLSPALIALLAVIFLGEYLTMWQVSGLFLLVIGAYALEMRSNNFLEPFTTFRDSKYIHYVLFSILLMSVSSVIDRLLLARYDMQPEAFLAFVHLFIAIIFMLAFTYNYGNLSNLRNGLKQYGLVILAIGILTVAHRYAQAESTKLAYVGLVVAVKRSSTLFITLFGGRLFHEKNLLTKTFACLIMIGGMLLIIL